MSQISLTYAPPSHGWLMLRLTVDGQMVKIVASDVPNNPMHDLANAIEQAAQGERSMVWWHLEPDGYFMKFVPIGHELEFRLEFATNSDRSRIRTIFLTRDGREKMLMFFWRFLREFQSHAYREPHWRLTDVSRMRAIKAKIVRNTKV